MLQTLLVVAVGFMPPLLSLWVLRSYQARVQVKLRQATIAPVLRVGQGKFVSDRYYLPGVGYLIGDITCQYNARCGYLRCAVNPQGPCDGCREREPREV